MENPTLCKLVTSQEEKKLADALKSDIPPLPDPDDPHWADAQGDSDPPPGGKPKKPKEEPAGWALDEGINAGKIRDQGPKLSAYFASLFRRKTNYRNLPVSGDIISGSQSKTA